MTAPATDPRPEPRTAGRRPKRRRFGTGNLGRAKVALPNGLTLGNLFFGINAIIAASRGDFHHACLYVVLGGVCDAFDGAAARATRTGGRFGEELDSLVDAISFGLAPAMIVHFSTLASGNVGWNVAVFVFAACAVMRLARFNITQAGGSKSYFQGLPSPAAGGTLATYWWFSQTSFYQNNAAIVDLPWNMLMQGLMLALGFLMVSDVPYPAWPKIGLRSWKGVLGLAAMLFLVFGIAYWRSAFFFPFGIAYVTYGLLRMLALGMWERRPRRDAYTGVPLPRRAGARGALAIPSEADLLDASDLLDPDDGADDEYDFFDDEDDAPAAAGPRGRDQALRARAERRDELEARRERRERRDRKKKPREERAARAERPERGERADRPDRTERPERAERPERPDRPPRPPREPRSPRAERPAVVPVPTEAARLGEVDVDMAEGEDDRTDEGAARPDGERRKRRKRRRSKGPGGGATGGATGGAAGGMQDAAGGDAGGRERTDAEPPRPSDAGEPPRSPAAPSLVVPSTPPPPPVAPLPSFPPADSSPREDRSE